MGLSLLAGPANAGKVALLLDRYLAHLDADPFLLVPNRVDVDRIERDLLGRAGCLFGGTIGTFDDLFRLVAGPAGSGWPVATDAQRRLLAARAVESVRRVGADLSPSARFSGYLDAVTTAVSEVEAALLDPTAITGDLGDIHRAYLAELQAAGLTDRDIARRDACRRLTTDFDAWAGAPVFAYGFEDLTAAEWSLLEALAGRAEVQVSLPYEPGRAAFASLRRTAEDLAALAGGNAAELPPRSSEYAAPALAAIERGLFEPDRPPVSIDGAVRFLSGAGTRGTLELVAAEILALLRAGASTDEIAVVVPSRDRWRAPLETVFTGFGIPYAVAGPVAFTSTSFGGALASLLRFAWAGGGRRDLFGFLRSSYSGVGRSGVDFVEGRLRGRAVSTPARVEEETERLREAPVVALRDLREAPTPLEGVRTVLLSMIRSAYPTPQPAIGETARLDLRAFGAAMTLLDELTTLEQAGIPVGPEELLDACSRLQCAAAPAEQGRIAVLDLLRARTRRFDTVFVLGLEEGRLPRRPRTSPFLDDERRRELGGRLEQADSVSRDRYLFYTACTRATRRLYLVREGATDDGSPLEASPFWHDVTALFGAEDVAHATRRRALSEITWPLESAPDDRERLRAVARLAADPDGLDLARALAEANGWERRLRRARFAFDREPMLRNPAVLAQFRDRAMFGATELERYVDCSSAWLIERIVSPKTIDAEPDPLLRGKIAHQALYAFYNKLPKELGAERVSPELLDRAIPFLESCLDDAIASGVRLDLSEVDFAEFREGLWRDLERFIRTEAASPLTFSPRRFELSFGTDRSVPEMQRGLELSDGIFMSGKIDRVDIDPMSARGIVQDYKSGKGAFSAREIDQEHRLQIPLYMLVLRDLAGIEPLGGVYRALSGSRATRGMLREEARDDLIGFKANDYLDEERFWGQVEVARDRALGAAQGIRAGVVAHDPRGGECPSWCDLWTICRVERG